MVEFLTNGKLLSEYAISLEIKNQQNNLSWVDFELYHTSVITVIMVIFVSKEKYQSDMQFHSCFTVPPWANKSFNSKYLKQNNFKTISWKLNNKKYLKEGKFDINWQQKLFLKWYFWKWKLLTCPRSCRFSSHTVADRWL
jgi:hypothetical protein